MFPKDQVRKVRLREVKYLAQVLKPESGRSQDSKPRLSDAMAHFTATKITLVRAVNEFASDNLPNPECVLFL